MDELTKKWILKEHGGAIRELTAAIVGVNEDSAAQSIFISHIRTKIKNVDELPIVKTCRWLNQQPTSELMKFKSLRELVIHISKQTGSKAGTINKILVNKNMSRLDFLVGKRIKRKFILMVASIPPPVGISSSTIDFLNEKLRELKAISESLLKDIKAMEDTIIILKGE